MPSSHLKFPVGRRAATGPPAPTLSTRLRGSGSLVTLIVAGDVDLVTAPVLQEALERARLAIEATSGPAELVVDMRAVSFLSAAGLNALAFAHILCVDDGTTMRVVGDQRVVRHPMELTGLHRLLPSR